jgi:hypothetical protein
MHEDPARRREFFADSASDRFLCPTTSLGPMMLAAARARRRQAAQTHWFIQRAG